MKEQMPENPRSRQAEGKSADETSPITKKVKPTTEAVVPAEDTHTNSGYEIIQPVDRTRKPDSPEAARQKLNAVRDARTNLGRSKPGSIVID